MWSDTSIFPEIDLPPSLEHLRPDVEIKYLTFTGKKREIYIDEEENSIRENDHSENTESIDSLRNSFQGGIQTTCHLHVSQYQIENSSILNWCLVMVELIHSLH